MRFLRKIKEDRILAILLLGLTAAYWQGVQVLETLRSDDAVGPAGFPRVLAIATFFLSVALFLRPDRDEDQPSIGGAIWVYWAIFFGYILLLPVTGFVLATGLFLFLMFFLLKTPAVRAGILALLITLVFYLIFVVLLGLNLPLGPRI